MFLTPITFAVRARGQFFTFGAAVNIIEYLPFGRVFFGFLYAPNTFVLLVEDVVAAIIVTRFQEGNVH